MLGIGLPVAAQCSDTLEPKITHNEILECDTISIFIRVDSRTESEMGLWSVILVFCHAVFLQCFSVCFLYWFLGMVLRPWMLSKDVALAVLY